LRAVPDYLGSGRKPRSLFFAFPGIAAAPKQISFVIPAYAGIHLDLMIAIKVQNGFPLARE
jgi:hypothetical protein